MNDTFTGKTLGGYELRRRIGQGGMGAVYESFQASVKRPVAVKVLPHEIAQQPGYRERFHQEVRLAASLEHPHILPVHDFGIQDGIAYIVMRLLTGGDLRARIAHEGRFARPKAQKLLLQISDALDYAHSKGVIHRDLKAGNILFDERDNAYLTDFGIAKVVGLTGLTGTGQTIGTPAYMAPELWQGGQIDVRADIYALGVLTYEVLTGRLPFQAETPPQMMYMHLNEVPQPINAYDPSLPSGVGDVLGRALAKNPDERYPTAGEMVSALDAALSAPPATPRIMETAREPTAQTPPARRGVALPLGVLIVLALVIGGALIALGLALGEEDDNANEVVIVPTDTATATPTDTPTSTPSLTHTATNTPTNSPTATNSPTNTPTNTPTETHTPTDTPTETPTPTHTAIPSATPTDIPLPTVQPTPSGNTFSPTGGEAVRRVNPDNLDRLRLLDVLPAGGSPIINGAMSEDGRYFVSANAQGEVLLWDLETRTQLARLEGHAPGDFFVAEFAPEGDRLVTQDAIFTRRLWALPSAELLAEYDEEFGAIAMAFSPEGRYLATGGYSNSVYVWDAATGEEVTRLEGHSNYVFHVAFSKNGRWLASVGPDSPLHVWDVAAWMLDQTIDLDNGARLWAADFTWDDDMLAVSSGNLEQPGRLHFVDRASGQELFTRDVHTSTVFDVVWTPSYLFSVDFDSVLNLWTAQGDLVHSQEGIACGVMPLSETLFVVSTQQGGSVFYDLPDGSPNPVQPFSDLAPNSCVYINLVGNLYITTSADGLVRLWGIPE